MTCYLIFDLGTSYFKACLIDQRGKLLGVSRTPSPIDYSDDGRAEMAPAAFRTALLKLASQLRSERSTLSDVTAISFASQANSFTLLDKNNQPILPLIIWCDARARDGAFPLREFAQSAAYYKATGVAEIDDRFMPAKLHWLREREAALVRATCKVAGISDFLALWLTGRLVAEASVAWLTGLVDVHQAKWWLEACEAQSIPLKWLPEIVLAGTDLGPVLPSVAKELGVSTGCRFIVGCLDQFAGAIGVGNVLPGGVSETTGTVLATVRCSAKFRPLPLGAVYQGPASRPGEYYQMSFGGFSAALLESYRNGLPEHPSFATLDAWAAEAMSGGGLAVDRQAFEEAGRCAFLSAGSAAGRGNEVYAILKAVADDLAGHVTALCESNPPDLVRSAGGASRSELWQHIKSVRLGCPVVATNCEEPTSLGAAMIAHRTLYGDSLERLASDWITLRQPAYNPTAASAELPIRT